MNDLNKSDNLTYIETLETPEIIQEALSYFIEQTKICLQNNDAKQALILLETVEYTNLRLKNNIKKKLNKS